MSAVVPRSTATGANLKGGGASEARGTGAYTLTVCVDPGGEAQAPWTLAGGRHAHGIGSCGVVRATVERVHTLGMAEGKARGELLTPLPRLLSDLAEDGLRFFGEQSGVEFVWRRGLFAALRDHEDAHVRG